MGHFYTQDGNQIAQVEYATKPGQFRDPNLKDAKKGDWAWGVTTVIGNGYRHNLERWKIIEGIKAALRIDRDHPIDGDGDHPTRPHMEDGAYLAEILEASKQVSKDTADVGTKIHAAIEGTLQGRGGGPLLSALRGRRGRVHRRPLR